MLYPIATDSRIVMDLSGVWKFMIDKEVEAYRCIATTSNK